MRAVTDSGNDIEFSDNPDRAGVNNLLTIYQALTGKSSDEVDNDFQQARGYGDLKKAVLGQVVNCLEPLQSEYNRLMNEQGYLDEILANGLSRAAQVANETLRKAKDKIGLLN